MAAKGTGLRVKGLTIAEGSRLAARDLDLEVKPGALHMVLGERDTGKTALLEGLAGIRREEAGAVSIGDSLEASASERRRAARYIAHERGPCHLTLLGRLLLAHPPRRLGIAIHGPKARTQAHALAKRVGLEEIGRASCRERVYSSV